MDIKESKFKIIVKTKAKENRIEGFDPSRKAYIIRIKGSRKTTRPI